MEAQVPTDLAPNLLCDLGKLLPLSGLFLIFKLRERVVYRYVRTLIALISLDTATQQGTASFLGAKGCQKGLG